MQVMKTIGAPAPVVGRRVLKRKGSPRKALSQKKTKDANTDMQALTSSSAPPLRPPAHPPALPSQAQSQPTFVPLATLPTLFQSPMMNSNAHVPLQHFATPPTQGSHVSTLSLLNSLQDDKLALILPILVRMEHKIDQLVAMMGSIVANQSSFPVAASGQLIASMTGSQTNAAMMGSQSNAYMTGTHPNAQVIGSQPNSMIGIQVNAPVVRSQTNGMTGSQSNVTMMVNQSHAPEVGNQLNGLMETPSNASIIATQPNFQTMGSHSNAAVGNHPNPQAVGNQPNAVMGTQSNSTLTGTQQSSGAVAAPIQPPNSQMVGSHSNTPEKTNKVNAVTGTQWNGTLTGTQSRVQMLAIQSTANVVGTQSTSPSSTTMTGSQNDIHTNGVQSNTQTVASQLNTSVMSPQANASIMRTQSNLGNQRHGAVMASPLPSKIETSGEELSLVVGPEFPLNPDEIIAIRVRANSAMNFAVKLMRKIFSHDELVGRNISGVRGKDKVDEKRVNIIRELVFKLYQTSPLEKETVWRNCHKAMDSYLRGLIYRHVHECQH